MSNGPITPVLHYIVFNNDPTSDGYCYSYTKLRFFYERSFVLETTLDDKTKKAEFLYWVLGKGPILLYKSWCCSTPDSCLG